jgi:hypothetical protein
MFVREMFETARPILLKELWTVVNRKLGSILLSPRINSRKNKDDMIQRRPQMQNNLANQEKHFVVGPHLVEEPAQDLLRGVPTLDNANIEYAFANSVDERFQLRQLFFCPSIPEMRLLKLAHLL